MHTNIIDLIISNHDRLLAILEKLTHTNASDLMQRHRLLDMLTNQLSVHAQLEEEIIYPHLLKNGDRELCNQLKDGIFLIDHFALPDLRNLGLNGTNFASRLSTLKRIITTHIKRENTQLFNRLSYHSTEVELQGLAEKWLSRQNALSNFGYAETSE